MFFEILKYHWHIMDKIYDILLQMSLEYNGRQYTIEHIIGNTVSLEMVIYVMEYIGIYILINSYVI